MSLQSVSREHPVLLGLIAAVFLAVAVPGFLWLQGMPVWPLFADGNLVKFLAACLIFGAVMTGFALVMRRFK